MKAQRFATPSLRIALLVSAMAFMLLPSTASADSWVTGCVSYYGGASATCVKAKTGAKNKQTRRQWVGPVRAEVRGICFDGGTKTLEIWGDGFYYSKYKTPSCRRTAEWSVNRWVRSGTNVCAASTSRYGKRRIACIAIRV
jgi:hypothetical protein